MDYSILINLIPTLILTGVIWTIQLVHYPSFEYISQDRFSKHMSMHVKKITYIVGPLMLLELILSPYLIIIKNGSLAYINLLCIILIWASTITLSIPCHNKLQKEYDLAIIHKLVQTNWPRTILWTIKSVILIIIFGG